MYIKGGPVEKKQIGAGDLENALTVSPSRSSVGVCIRRVLISRGSGWDGVSDGVVACFGSCVA